MAEVPITHPFEPELSFLYGTIFTGPPLDAGHHSRNVCIVADGEVDRLATGTGVSARAALHHARGELQLNQEITIESILGTTMSVAVVQEPTSSLGAAMPTRKCVGFWARTISGYSMPTHEHRRGWRRPLVQVGGTAQALATDRVR